MSCSFSRPACLLRKQGWAKLQIWVNLRFKEGWRKTEGLRLSCRALEIQGRGEKKKGSLEIKGRGEKRKGHLKFKEGVKKKKGHLKFKWGVKKKKGRKRSRLSCRALEVGRDHVRLVKIKRVYVTIIYSVTTKLIKNPHDFLCPDPLSHNCAPDQNSRRVSLNSSAFDAWKFQEMEIVCVSWKFPKLEIIFLISRK